MNNNTNSLYTYILIVFLGLAMIQMQNIGTYRSGSSPSINENDIMDHIRYLSHKDRAGRYPGTRESKDVISYLIRHFKSFGVQPGGGNGSFVQPFNITDGIELGKNNSLIIDGDSLVTGRDYMPLWFSGNETVSASAVFAGYGFSIDEKELKWNDYNGLDVVGKWVIVMRHGPERNNQHSLYSPHSGLHKKMLVARDKGALGIIYVSQTEDTDIHPLKYIAGYSNAGIPAIHISNEMADELFKTDGWTLERIQKTMNKSLKSIAFKLPVTINASVDLNPIQTRAANVVGLIQSGNRKYRNEYVVIGAHFDHIGMGGAGTGSRKPDTSAIHFGADDNASGTAGLLEIAQKLVSQKSRLKRSVILLAFDAEEKGLLGAKYFTENPLVDLQDIPVLFFFTGFHNEYHTPEDSWKLINLKGEKDILDFVYDITFQLSRLSERPVFTEAGPKKGRMNRNTKFKVTFGIVPVYGSTKKGLEIDGISKPDGPAAKAGIIKGDVIKSMGGKPINDIYEYMERLEEIEPGMTITVLINRDGSELRLPVTF
ncbi:MAG: M20/M25/M40 family metallo-hydrolase [Fidelibacterota bacterium]